MSNYRRVQMPGGVYFFTLVTHCRRPLFSSGKARCCLHNAIKEVRDRHPFEIEAICLLPDHLHTIWKLPADDHAYSQRWNEIKGIFSKRFRDLSTECENPSQSRQRKGEVSFWQRRFWEHLIRDETDFRHHMDYLHYNPAKHGLVKYVVDWPWSSFHRLVREGIYPVDGGGSTSAKMNLDSVGER
ncbi:MAG: transposase [Candidatus Thiodiazotropha sp. (ex Ustalcina ferruginea)]|nr:transposase [Candidatus Thiodiazotropha sp. (ex Ustalcina ferruginea)]